MNRGRLEAFVEQLLMAGLGLSALVLVAGLATGRGAWLHAGVLLLMVTPGLRVAVVTIGLVARRDYVFAALSFGALCVLATSAFVAFHQ